jgi:hypothetical protein
LEIDGREGPAVLTSAGRRELFGECADQKIPNSAKFFGGCVGFSKGISLFRMLKPRKSEAKLLHPIPTSLDEKTIIHVRLLFGKSPESLPSHFRCDRRSSFGSRRGFLLECGDADVVRHG